MISGKELDIMSGLRILLLEDVQDDADLIELELRKEGLEFLLKRVESKQEFVRQLDEYAPDIVLSDYRLPSFDGLSALENVRKQRPDLPFILVTGAMGEELAVETFKKGSTDYVLKDNLSRLVPAVKRAISEAEEHRARKEADKALKEAYDEISKLKDNLEEHFAIHYMNFLNTPTGITITDPDGNIVEANRAFLNLYGYKLEEVKGNNPRILKSGRQAPEVYKKMWADISNREIGFWTGELINRKRNGDEIHVLLTISAVYRSGGSLIGYVASTVDITARRLMEIEMLTRTKELEQLNKFKSDMIAITSHDLKSPINAMISYADLIREDLGTMPQEKTEHFLSKISEYGRNLTKFIGELLDQAKIESGKFQLITTRARLDAVLKGCIDINQAHSVSRRISILLKREGKSRCAVVDVLRMTQVFNNILSNAVKFSPEGGEIAVTYRDTGRKIIITIDDQGQGLPEDELDAIFNQYYQVIKSGTIDKRAFGAGIGLSVVSNIVALHNGTVRAENLPIGGCRFTIEMPHKTFTSFRGLSVLAIDPEGTSTDSIMASAHSLGVDCFAAKDKLEAAKIIEIENIDAVFTGSSNVATGISGYLQSLPDRDDNLLFVKIGDESPFSNGRFCCTIPGSLDVADVENTLIKILEIKLGKVCYE